NDLGAPNAPDAICPSGGQCFADVPPSNPFYRFTNRIYQQDLVTGYPCGGPGEPCDPESRPYYRPANNVTRQQMAKFIDNARRLPQIFIETTSPSAPIYVSNTVSSAVYASSGDGSGVVAISHADNDAAIRGEGSYLGVYGSS